jgi:pyridoxal phosphate enzyme (YggS family)
MADLNICLQVNISGEESKSGVAPEDVVALALRIATLPRIRLRGLMAVPEPTSDVAQQRQAFRHLRELSDKIVAQGFLDTLSMGMSSDLHAAIAEGSTMVRIGTGIFGSRNYAK